ncbi:Sterol regulatory element-binding protein cleavage-activating protein [Neolecta irregularis DAH-3]|uniref:Sterol regulatory element-binding protein cleavage-activating protein n=1 Tax=Neolecta irregularis (strain DAH-3) TaxID=1198029 RepID=A0A1U7LVJ1_NEOID|nr:Sterol regulatory element-binding protein cleavage-activating protein [Neolecta irregularis DAH-3]|eukprot:OLL26695.1 Sterol regulatory element-binding protein cleavage-activating protein [Neolecta irregularis DAH-3]
MVSLPHLCSFRRPSLPKRCPARRPIHKLLYRFGFWVATRPVLVTVLSVLVLTTLSYPAAYKVYYEGLGTDLVLEHSNHPADYYILNQTESTKCEPNCIKIDQLDRIVVFGSDCACEVNHQWDRIQLSNYPYTATKAFLLRTCYALLTLYGLISVRNLRYVRSRFGLAVSALFKFFAVFASALTVCALLGRDLSIIVPEALPFIVIVIGMENVFRLANSVSTSPMEHPVSQRIARGLGDTGFVSFSVVLFNITFLVCLSLITHPAIREFCVFTSIALAIDFTVHLTYFLAILAIDIRRYELQDLIQQSPFAETSPAIMGHSPHTLKDALSQYIYHALPWSTNVAGTRIGLVMITVLMIHYMEFMNLKSVLSIQYLNNFLAPRRSYSPEILRILKSIARGMLKGKRSVTFEVDLPPYRPTLNFMEFYNSIKPHFRSFSAVSLIILISTGIILRLIIRGITEEPNSRSVSEETVNIKSFDPGHKLDIVLITSGGRNIVSVDMGRTIIVSCISKRGRKYRFEVPSRIHGIANDEDNVALVTDRSVLIVWEGKLISSWDVTEDSKHYVVGIWYAIDGAIVVLYRNGVLREFRDRGSSSRYVVIKAKSVKSVVPSHRTLRIEYLLLVDNEENVWMIGKFGGPLWRPVRIDTKGIDQITGISLIPDLKIMAIGGNVSISLVDITLGSVLLSVPTGQIRQNSLRAAISSPVPCQRCHSASIRSFSLIYTDDDRGYLQVHNFKAPESSTICLRCSDLNPLVADVHWLDGVVAWDTLPSMLVMGIRQSTPSDSPELRLRKRTNRDSSNLSNWETWYMTLDGYVTTRPLKIKISPLDRPGPTTLVGRKGLAISMGKQIILLSKSIGSHEATSLSSTTLSADQSMESDRRKGSRGYM